MLFQAELLRECYVFNFGGCGWWWLCGGCVVGGSYNIYIYIFLAGGGILYICPTDPPTTFQPIGRVYIGI